MRPYRVGDILQPPSGTELQVVSISGDYVQWRMLDGFSSTNRIKYLIELGYKPIENKHHKLLEKLCS